MPSDIAIVLSAMWIGIGLVGFKNGEAAAIIGFFAVFITGIVLTK